MESDRIALITGGAHGIGAALARRLAGLGTGWCWPTSTPPADRARVVAEAVRAYGGLDIVALNAGVLSGCDLGDDFDPTGGRPVDTVLDMTGGLPHAFAVPGLLTGSGRTLPRRLRMAACT